MAAYSRSSQVQQGHIRTDTRYKMDTNESEFNDLFDELLKFEGKTLTPNDRFIFTIKTGDGPIRQRAFLSVLTRLAANMVHRNHSFSLSQSISIYLKLKTMIQLLNDYLSHTGNFAQGYDNLLVAMYQWQCILFTRKQGDLDAVTYNSKLYAALDNMILDIYNISEEKEDSSVAAAAASAAYGSTPISDGYINDGDTGDTGDAAETNSTAVGGNGDNDDNDEDDNESNDINDSDADDDKDDNDDEQSDNNSDDTPLVSNVIEDVSDDDIEDEAFSSIKIGSKYELADGRIAIVKFVGEVEFSEGMWYGFEADTGYKGKNDGSVKGVNYFDCKKGKGIFINDEKMKLASEYHGKKKSSTKKTKDKSKSSSSSSSKKKKDNNKKSKDKRKSTKKNKKIKTMATLLASTYYLFIWRSLL